MRIGFDIGPVTASRSGVGNYCLHLLRHLLEMDDLEISGFAASTRKLDLDAVGRAIRYRHLLIPTRVMYKVWSTLGVPRVDSLLGGVDVYHATNYFLPPTRRAKRVLTIHDITFKKHPELCSPKVVGPFSEKVGGFAREADAVIADSESTRRDIIEMLKVPEQRVHTVHLAVDGALAALPNLEARKQVAQTFELNHPYILFVGTIEPRKNIIRLIRAFQQLRNEFPHRLVLAGAKGWMTEEIEKEIAFAKVGLDGNDIEKDSLTKTFLAADERKALMTGRIVTTGFTSQQTLLALYSAADALVFPSLYEGFGLPVLEAMACGCPVITANNSSLPEVGGDAAEYCDANDIDSIANAMRRVLSDSSLRESMHQRGLAQAAKFSWKKTAEQTAAVYRSLCA